MVSVSSTIAGQENSYTDVCNDCVSGQNEYHYIIISVNFSTKYVFFEDL